MSQRYRPWTESSAGFLLFLGAPITLFGLCLFISGFAHTERLLPGLIFLAIGVVLTLAGFAVYRI